LLGIAESAAPALLSQIRLSVDAQSKDSIAPVNRQIAPTADGSFTLNGIPPSRLYFYLAGSPDVFGVSLLGYEQYGVFTRDGLELRAGESPGPVRVFLLGRGQGVIRGQVQFLNGVWPTEHQLQVAAVPKNIPTIPSQMLGQRPLQSALVDQGGRFVLEKLLPGEYELVVLSRSGFGQRGPLSEAALQSARHTVTVTNGESQAVLKIDLGAPVAPRKEGNE